MFKTKKNTELMTANGFLVLDLFDESEIESLIKLYKNSPCKEEIFSGLSYSLISKKYTENEAIEAQINDVIEKKLNTIFENYEPIGASFINKIATENPTEFNLHQDWAYTDESKHENCFTAWIPLQNTTIENGCVYALPGSHLYFKNLRSADYETARIGIHSSSNLAKKIIPIEMKKGQILFFKQALFHGSFPNKSALDRLTSVVIIKDKKTPLYYYNRLDSTHSNQFAIDAKAFTLFLKKASQGEISKQWKLEKTIEYSHTLINEEMLIEKSYAHEANN